MSDSLHNVIGNRQDEALLAATRSLAKTFATNKPVNGSKDFTVDARAALEAARPYLMPTAEQIAEELQAHYPRTGMVVASGVTCECGYWNGVESPGRDRPAGAQGRDGLNW